MAITLRSDHEQRLLDAVREGGFESADDAMDTALEMLYAQNEWLREGRADCRSNDSGGRSKP